jgi:hypothetical protein
MSFPNFSYSKGDPLCIIPGIQQVAGAIGILAGTFIVIFDLADRVNLYGVRKLIKEFEAQPDEKSKKKLLESKIRSDIGSERCYAKQMEKVEGTIEEKCNSLRNSAKKRNTEAIKEHLSIILIGLIRATPIVGSIYSLWMWRDYKKKTAPLKI